MYIIHDFWIKYRDEQLYVSFVHIILYFNAAETTAIIYVFKNHICSYISTNDNVLN